jgi:hypothetical protein
MILKFGPRDRWPMACSCDHENDRECARSGRPMSMIALTREPRSPIVDPTEKALRPFGG